MRIRHAFALPYMPVGAGSLPHARPPSKRLFARWSADWRVLYYSPAAKRAMRFSGPIEGRPLAEVFPGVVDSPWIDACRRAAATQEPQTVVTTSVALRGVRVFGTVIHDEGAYSIQFGYIAADWRPECYALLPLLLYPLTLA